MGRKTTDPLPILLWIKCSRPLLSHHFTWVNYFWHSDAQLFLLNQCVSLNPLWIQPCKPKLKGDKKERNQQKEKVSRKLLGLKPRDAPAAQAVLIMELCYWLLCMRWAGSVPSFLEYAACLWTWDAERLYEQSCCFIYSQLIMLNCKQNVCFSSVDNYPLVNISLKYLQHLATAQNCYIKMNILSQ